MGLKWMASMCCMHAMCLTACWINAFILLVTGLFFLHWCYCSCHFFYRFGGDRMTAVKRRNQDKMKPNWITRLRKTEPIVSIIYWNKRKFLPISWPTPDPNHQRKSKALDDPRKIKKSSIQESKYWFWLQMIFFCFFTTIRSLFHSSFFNRFL